MIKLTDANTGADIYVEPQHIVCVSTNLYRSGRKQTCVDFTSSLSIEVAETVEQVLELLEPSLVTLVLEND